MMRSPTYMALFTGSVAAQSSVTLFNLFTYQSTLTQIGSDATATTYKNDCPANSAGISVLPPSLRPSPDNPSITPAPTPRARLARQASPSASADDSEPEIDVCEPYILKQGALTWEFHMTDPLPGAYTVDMNCRWQGAITTADLTCTVVAAGNILNSDESGTSVTVYSNGEVQSLEPFSAVAIVTASGAASASASASQTPSDSGAKSVAPAPSGSASSSRAASGSGPAASARSTGFAPVGLFPTGVMAFVGGAAVLAL